MTGKTLKTAPRSVNNAQNARKKPKNAPKKTYKKPINSKIAAKKASKKRINKPKRVKKRQKVQALWWRITKFITYWLCFFATLAIILGMGVFLYYSLDLPNPDTLQLPKATATVTIITSDGEVLTHRAAQQTGYISIKLLPEHTKQALISIEDRGFYNHNGVDVFGILRAAIFNVIRGNRAQGGSTLTQQLAKMLYLKPEKKLKRKVQEAMLAIWLESKYSKDKLLELYFNRAYYGAGANGIEAAAQKYFDKSARYLNLNESALLAGLMKAPSAYNPLRHPKRAKNRQKLVLNAMLEEGYIDQAQLDLAKNSPIGLNQTNVASQGQYAADWIMRDLKGIAGDLVGDITVETTIDPYLQRAAENALNSVMSKFSVKYKAEQAALILMDKNGAVRALVGGRNYKKSSFNRVTTAKRQPGSIFKPFVYLAGLEAGYKPTSKMRDAPIRFKNWRPKNYNNKYYGNVTLKHSLAKSMNSVALRLARKVGVKKIINVARRLGISSDLRKDLSIALGTSEVTLQELTTAYLPFMNGGFDANAHVIARIVDSGNQEVFTQYSNISDRIIAKKHINYMNDMLFAVTDWGTGKKARLPNFKSFGKTGTTQNYKDGWFIGYTSEYIAGVWVGNDNGKPTNKVTGGNLPAQIWHDLMLPIHDGLTSQAGSIDTIGSLINSR
ncbi:MAG: PBP1A family penicillin-binding protein [Rhizobiales bacterium]|nr:PBP1A family penicillin-binding protein [Hyphomicrobiales bacterium]